MCYWLIAIWPFGQAKPSNILKLVTLILLKYLHPAKYLISPAKHLLIDQDSHVTVH
jgi:hypothetical protein